MRHMIEELFRIFFRSDFKRNEPAVKICYNDAKEDSWCDITAMYEDNVWFGYLALLDLIG